jgi:hypothetical protein
MRTIAVRLNDDQLRSLDRIDSPTRSDAIRSLIEKEQGTLFVSGVTEDELVAELQESHLIPVDYAPESAAMQKLEHWFGSAQSGIKLDLMATTGQNMGQNLMTAAANEYKRDTETGAASSSLYVDPIILAMMRLSEYYFATEGDIFTAMTVPLEVGYQDFDFVSGDKGAIRACRSYLEDQLRLHEVLEGLYLDEVVYGQGYPIKQGGEVPDAIILPNPKHVAVSHPRGLGTPTMAYAPQDSQAVVDVLAEQPDFLFSPTYTNQWNEKDVPLVQSVPFKVGSIEQISLPKFQHNPYAQPWLSRASRAIDSRRYLEEMARATIEGVRNQLWVFTVDNPVRGEITALRSQIAAGRSARTGMLVWRGGLNVQMFVPGTIDNLLANETAWAYTMQVYRQLGITVRVVSGENPNRGSSADAETDVKVFLNRINYSRGKNERWMQRLVNAFYGNAKGKVPVVKLKDVELAVAQRLKDRLLPLLQYGLASPTRAFTEAGMDAESEKEQLIADDDFRTKYIRSYTGFAQSSPYGNTASPEPGRPVARQENEPRQKAAASLQGDYSDEIERLFSDMLTVTNDPDQSIEDKRRRVEWFILGLLAAAATWRRQAYIAGYVANGGIGQPSEDAINRVIAWDTANADKFQEDMLLALSGGEGLDQYWQRAGLYAMMGYRMAYTSGVFQAKQEQGYVAWRRLLRPYASKSGPCAVCIADAKTTHPIAESFFDHVNGVCGMVYLTFYRSQIETPSIVEIPAQVNE